MQICFHSSLPDPASFLLPLHSWSKKEQGLICGSLATCLSLLSRGSLWAISTQWEDKSFAPFCLILWIGKAVKKKKKRVSREPIRFFFLPWKNTFLFLLGDFLKDWKALCTDHSRGTGCGFPKGSVWVFRQGYLPWSPAARSPLVPPGSQSLHGKGDRGTRDTYSCCSISLSLANVSIYKPPNGGARSAEAPRCGRDLLYPLHSCSLHCAFFWVPFIQILKKRKHSLAFLHYKPHCTLFGDDYGKKHLF